MTVGVVAASHVVGMGELDLKVTSTLSNVDLHVRAHKWPATMYWTTLA